MRNPVGNTHEVFLSRDNTKILVSQFLQREWDIDALFAVIRKGFVGQSWGNVDEFADIVRASISHFTGNLIVEVVTDTLDFKLWLGAEHVLNRQLSQFCRHGGPAGLFHPGMHVFR